MRHYAPVAKSCHQEGNMKTNVPNWFSVFSHTLARGRCARTRKSFTWKLRTTRWWLQLNEFYQTSMDRCCFISKVWERVFSSCLLLIDDVSTYRQGNWKILKVVDSSITTDDWRNVHLSYPALRLSHFCVENIHHPLLIELVWSANIRMLFPHSCKHHQFVCVRLFIK